MDLKLRSGKRVGHTQRNTAPKRAKTTDEDPETVRKVFSSLIQSGLLSGKDSLSLSVVSKTTREMVLKEPIDLSWKRLCPPELESFKRKITALQLYGATDLSFLTECDIYSKLQDLNLRHISLQNITNVLPLGHLTQLKILNLSGCKSLDSVSGLDQCRNLQVLIMMNMQNLQDISPLAHCISLRSLNIADCKLIRVLPALGQCAQLQTVNLKGCRDLESTAGLSQCSGLTFLYLRENALLRDIVLTQCSGLQALEISHPGRFVTTLSGLPQQLRRLHISHAFGLADLNGLEQCTNLETLQIANCPMVEDISALHSCKSLERLYLPNCNITDISALASCADLKYLNIERNQNLADVDAIMDLKRLFEIRIYGCQISRNDISKFRRRATSVILYESTVY